MDLKDLGTKLGGALLAVNTAFAGAAVAKEAEYGRISNIHQPTKTDGGQVVPDGSYVVFKDPSGEMRHISVEELIKHSTQGAVPFAFTKEQVLIDFSGTEEPASKKINVDFTGTGPAPQTFQP